MTAHAAPRQRGFSLVELMISVVIGMLALMFALQLVSGSEKFGRTEVGSSDSMQNGMVAMFSMSKDAAQGGFGLNDPILAGCDTLLAANARFALAPATRGSTTIHPLAPVVIESHGQSPDRISFYSGGAMGGTPSMGVQADYGGGSQIIIDTVPYAVPRASVLAVAPLQAGGQCVLAETSDDASTHAQPPSQQYLQFAAASDLPFNTGQLGLSFAASTARVFNLGAMGTLSFHSWSVQNGYLQLSAADLSSSGATPASVTDNIVSIKAEYGFDTRTAANFLPSGGMVISQWSPTMIDADGDGVTGGQGDWGRIAAVRIAVVARSRAADAPGSSGSCTTTTVQPQVFITQTGSGALAVPLTLNVAVAGDTHDWKCYHYRTFETIVPLRNFGWRPS